MNNEPTGSDQFYFVNEASKAAQIALQEHHQAYRCGPDADRLLANVVAAAIEVGKLISTAESIVAATSGIQPHRLTCPRCGCDRLKMFSVHVAQGGMETNISQQRVENSENRMYPLKGYATQIYIGCLDHGHTFCFSLVSRKEDVIEIDTSRGGDDYMPEEIAAAELTRFETNFIHPSFPHA